MLRPSLHSLIAVVVLALTRPATSSDDAPTLAVRSGIAPTIVEIPCKARYRVYRHFSPGTNGANVIASASLPQIWTTSGARIAADSGEWTFERDSTGRWSSEFVVGDTVAQPSTKRSPARRYALEFGEQTVIREMLDPAAEPVASRVEPPPVFISDYARMTFPLSSLAIESAGEDGMPMTLNEALASFPIFNDVSVDGERTRTIDMHGGLAQLSVTTDGRGVVIRVEETAGDEGGVPLIREVTEITETRIVSGHQVPWRFSRTVFDRDRVWECFEFEMIEVTTPEPGR